MVQSERNMGRLQKFVKLDFGLAETRALFPQFARHGSASATSKRTAVAALLRHPTMNQPFGNAPNNESGAAKKLKQLVHPLDLRPKCLQLFFNALVAAIHVVDAVDDGFAIRRQCGDDQ